jgi:hypothetical protein
MGHKTEMKMNRISVLMRHGAVDRGGSAYAHERNDNSGRAGSDQRSGTEEPSLLRVGSGRPSRVLYWALTHPQTTRNLLIALMLAMMTAIALL